MFLFMLHMTGSKIETLNVHSYSRNCRSQIMLSHLNICLSNFNFMAFAFVQRITIPEILVDEWFKKDYKPPVFDEKEDTNLDDVEAVFKDSEVHL